MAKKPKAPEPKKKMVCLVFEDTGPHRFNFYSTGLEEVQDLPEDQWTEAQRAGADAFEIVRTMLADAGVIDSVHAKGKSQ